MEQELKDHTLKAVKVISDKELSFWHKTIEIAKEVLIIVFAVTLSIWFHDMSENNRQQREVKEFLVKLKLDLTSDVKEMEEDKETFGKTAKAFQYVTTTTVGFKLNNDSLKKYQPYIFVITSFLPHNSRYEGFKSSGKLGYIEDAQLQNDIMDLYQDIIPSILASTDSYGKVKNLLFQCFFKNIKNAPGGKTNVLEVLSSDEAKNISGALSDTGQIIERYQKAIGKAKKIIAAINNQYPGE
jgi:hypothetical protein